MITFEKQTLVYCPGCGSKEFIHMDNMDDYYVGCGYWCLKCSSIFHFDLRNMNKEEKQRMETV